MERSYAFLLLVLVSKVVSQERVLVDVISDIPNNDDSWFFDCDENGYGDLSTDIDCGEFSGGKIDIPSGDLNDERGFWTSCGFCEVRYVGKPGDVSLKARLYQRSMQTEVSFDGVSWSFISGEGWVEVEQRLGTGGRNQITFRFDHFISNQFNLLEKIVINGDFSPPTEPTTTPTTTPTTPTTPSTTTTESGVTETTPPICPTTPEPEPCNCCSNCPRSEPQKIHHHYHNYYHYRPTSMPKVEQEKQ